MKEEKNELDNRLDLKAILNISYDLILMFKPIYNLRFKLISPIQLGHDN